MRSTRLLLVAVLAVVVLCVALIHSAASGQGSATQPATATSASKPSPADQANARKAMGVLDRCCQCHRHGWQEEGKPKITWSKDIARLVAEGKYVAPGKPEKSALLAFVHDDKHPKYDSPEKLADDERTLEQWIARGCIDPKVKPASRPALSEMANARKAMGVLDRCCACHRHGWQEEGKPKVTWSRNIARLIEEKQVAPGNPDQSSLFMIVRDGKHPKYATPEVTADDVKTLDQWISQGCIDPKAKPAATKATSRPAGSGA